MKRINLTNKNGSINNNDSYEGESIEDKVKRLTINNEPIDDGAPLIYTERKEGVKPEYDIRTDRWDVAINAMDVVTKSFNAKRDEKYKEQIAEKNDGGAEPIQGTELDKN
ncbi:hypothetical protein [Microviridae sp.]|nr:hypothetical protein [Microviridae sp.]